MYTVLEQDCRVVGREESAGHRSWAQLSGLLNHCSMINYNTLSFMTQCHRPTIWHNTTIQNQFIWHKTNKFPCETSLEFECRDLVFYHAFRLPKKQFCSLKNMMLTNHIKRAIHQCTQPTYCKGTSVCILTHRSQMSWPGFKPLPTMLYTTGPWYAKIIIVICYRALRSVPG